MFSLLGQLPQVNVVLLRHLFGVLYNIEKHSTRNLMTAYNLSVCVAPNVLWPADSCGSESYDDAAKKVMRSLTFMPREQSPHFEHEIQENNCGRLCFFLKCTL